MATKTKTVDGAALTADKFAHAGDPQDPETWHLPLDTKAHCNSALDMFAHTDLPSSAKAPAARKIVAKARENNLDTTDFVKNHLSPTYGEAPRPWIEIFRAGDYTAAGKGKITREDLQRVVRNYDPTYHEAPVTIGHPKDDMPAYGWIDGLMLDGDTLLARESKVDPKFNEARQAGKFKKRSVAFYPNADGTVKALRHVGWLGAQPPEVKGLQDVKFDDHGSSFIAVEFGEDGQVAAEKSFGEQFMEFFKTLPGFSGGGGQPKTFSEDDVKRIVTEASAPLLAKVNTLETDLKTSATQFAEREKALAGGEVKQRATEAVTRLKAKGAWVPAFERQGVPLIFDELAKVTTTIEFGEGDAKKKETPLELLVQFMESLPKIVPGGMLVEPVLNPARAKNSTGDPFTDAVKKRKADKNITFSEAWEQIAAEQPELIPTGKPAVAGAV